MFISSANPSGMISNLNLSILPAWRLEIIGNGPLLGVGIRYVIPPTTTFAFIAAINTRATSGETGQIAEKGLTKGNKLEDKEVFIESLGMLNNASEVKQKDIDEILKTAPDLIDVYYDILNALETGQAKSGSFLDWRWNIRRDITGLKLIKEEKEVVPVKPKSKKAAAKVDKAEGDAELVVSDTES